MVGLGRLERPTSPLSGVRSNHLSYRPIPGGAGRDRTGDLLNANQALSQLSYSPLKKTNSRPVGCETTTSVRLQHLRIKLQVEIRDRVEVERLILTLALLYRSRTFLSVPPPTFSLRKEVIQPQVLLRLPCYDFTPIMSHTLGRCPSCELARRLLVQPTFVM